MSETPTTVPAGTVSSKYVLAGGKREERGKKSLGGNGERESWRESTDDVQVSE